MKTEGEYKTSKYLGLHRWGSLIIALIGIGLLLSAAHNLRSGRASVIFLLPLVFIWFAEQLSLWAIKNSGGWLNASNADTAVRITGWLILMILLGIQVMIHFAD